VGINPACQAELEHSHATVSEIIGGNNKVPDSGRWINSRIGTGCQRTYTIETDLAVPTFKALRLEGFRIQV